MSEKNLIQANRGKLTPELESLYFSETGRKLTTVELRLLPYIRHMFIENESIHADRISPEERDILKSLTDSGRIKFARKKSCPGYYTVDISEDFYDFINGMVFQSYVVKSSCAESNAVKSYSELMKNKRTFQKDEKTLKKIEYGVINGGYVDLGQLTKADLKLLDKLEKQDLIYFKVRENNEDRFDIGISNALWTVIMEETKQSLKDEKAFDWNLQLEKVE